MKLEIRNCAKKVRLWWAQEKDARRTDCLVGIVIPRSGGARDLSPVNQSERELLGLQSSIKSIHNASDYRVPSESKADWSTPGKTYIHRHKTPSPLKMVIIKAVYQIYIQKTSETISNIQAIYKSNKTEYSVNAVTYEPPTSKQVLYVSPVPNHNLRAAFRNPVGSHIMPLLWEGYTTCQC